jgi:hypothetical protein
MKDEQEKRDRLWKLHALLDKIEKKVERATFYASAVGAWARKRSTKRIDLGVLYLQWRTGTLGSSVTIRNPVALVKNLLDELEIEALSTLWDPGWGSPVVTGKKYLFVPAQGGKILVTDKVPDVPLKIEVPENAQKVVMPVEVTDPNLADRIQQLIKDNPELQEIPLPVKGEEPKP